MDAFGGGVSVPSRLPVRRTPIPPRPSRVLDSGPRQALLERSACLWAIHQLVVTTITQFTTGFCCVDGPFELSGVRQTTALPHMAANRYKHCRPRVPVQVLRVDHGHKVWLRDVSQASNDSRRDDSTWLETC